MKIEIPSNEHIAKEILDDTKSMMEYLQYKEKDNFRFTSREEVEQEIIDTLMSNMQVTKAWFDTDEDGIRVIHILPKPAVEVINVNIEEQHNENC